MIDSVVSCWLDGSPFVKITTFASGSLRKEERILYSNDRPKCPSAQVNGRKRRKKLEGKFVLCYNLTKLAAFLKVETMLRRSLSTQ
jgi:hypothetical protein